MYEDRANTRANINVKIRTRKKGGPSPRLASSLGTGAGAGALSSLHASKYRLCIHIYISNSERSASIYRLTTIPVSQNNRLHVEPKHDTEIKKSKPEIQIRTTWRQRCTGARVRGFERANVVAHALLRVGMI